MCSDRRGDGVTYLLGGADVGTAMRVRVTAINDGGRLGAVELDPDGALSDRRL